MSEWVWILSERYPSQFPASRLSQLREFRTSSFFNVLSRKKTMIKQSPRFDQLSVCWLNNWKMSYSELLATAALEKRKIDLGTFPRVVRLIPRSAGSISSLYGAKLIWKQKKSLFATSKKMSRITNGLNGKTDPTRISISCDLHPQDAGALVKGIPATSVRAEQ